MTRYPLQGISGSSPTYTRFEEFEITLPDVSGFSNLTLGNNGYILTDLGDGTFNFQQLESNTMYATRVDFITDNDLYRGEAVPGSLESAPVWRVRYIETAADGDVTTTWASGNADFDKRWDNRSGMIYS